MSEQITPEHIYLNRRELLKKSGFLLGLALPAKLNPTFKSDDKDHPLTKEELATSYNNFYEFSLDKSEVKPKSAKWKPQDPWKIEIAGLVDKPKLVTLEELIKMGGGLEERIYRFRCVEAWSMVVPWSGFSLATAIKNLGVNAKAKFVKFTSYADKKDFPNIADLSYYPWPYTEGLTIEEAKNPLTLMAVGLYGKPLPNQNGAPVRLVVPWKYGFKSIKSVVKIEFTDKQPQTLWSQLAPAEYGFYANVNPEVDHPRWSQATERVLDGKIFPTRRKTLMYNGYSSEVAHLYKGMNLKENY